MKKQKRKEKKIIHMEIKGTKKILFKNIYWK